MICTHQYLASVELQAAGETVAQLCEDCGVRLPPWFGCPECEYGVNDIVDQAGTVVRRDYQLIDPCPRHQGPAVKENPLITLDFDYQAVHYQTDGKLPTRPKGEDRYLSQDQLDHLAGILRDIPGLLEDLEIATVKDVRFPARTPDGDGSEAPIPFNPAAADAQHRLTQAVCGATALLWHRAASGMAQPVWDATEAAEWLHGQLDRLALDPQAEESAQEIDRAARRALRVIDHPPDPRYAGICPHCSEDLYAEHGATIVTCICGCSTSLDDLHAAALKAGAHMLFTDTELVGAIALDQGRTVTRRQIQRWRDQRRLTVHESRRYKAGRLVTVQTSRLSDVRTLVDELQRKRAA